MRPDRTSEEFCSLLLDAAKRHGEDSGEPDHEVGDLQTFFKAGWSIMSPAQRVLALSNPEVQYVLDSPEYRPLLESDHGANNGRS